MKGSIDQQGQGICLHACCVVLLPWLVVRAAAGRHRRRRCLCLICHTPNKSQIHNNDPSSSLPIALVAS